MIKKKSLYSKPRRAYEASRIKEENVLLEKYGLKNKREIWKTIAKLDYFRARAKALAKANPEEQQILFNKLNALGLKINSIADVLALKVENILERRLPTIIYKKSIAKTTKEARQMVVHKRILINGKIVDIPSYLVSVSEENEIKMKQMKPKKEVKSESQEKAQEGEK